MKSIALIFILSIAAYKYFSFFPVSVTLSALIILFVLIIKSRNRKRVLLIVLVFLSGMLYSFLRQPSLPEIILPDSEVMVEGIVSDIPQKSGDKISFTVEAVYIERENYQGKVRLFFLQDFLQQKVPADFLMPGERICALAKIREPAGFRNPGLLTFDMRTDGIIATGYVKQIQVTGYQDDWQAMINRQRQKLGIIIDNSLSSENAAFFRAIIPGLKKGISDNMRDNFTSTGLAHLLSISGTHFGLLAFVLFWITKTLFKNLPGILLRHMTLYITPTQIAVVIIIPVLIVYAFISGMSLPTIRSLIMVSIYLIAVFIGRKNQWLNSIALAAIIILLLQPKALFEISFQLSFIAVISIGYILEKKNVNISGGITRVAGKIMTGAVISSVAVLGTAPFVILYFKQFPLISPVTNLIITPLVCFVLLPVGFFTGFYALIFNMPLMPLNGMLNLITDFVLNTINIFSVIPYSSVHVHNPSFLLIALYYCSVLLLFKSKKGFYFGIIPLVLVICFYLVTPHLFQSSLKVTFLDVGEGDSAFVRLPDNKTMLIDGGSKELKTGRRVVAPYLWSKGINRIDYLVLSHSHSDHYGGLIYIMENLSIGEAWLNGRIVPEAAEFFRKLKKSRIPYRTIRRGDVLEAERYNIYILHPYDEFNGNSGRGSYSAENNNSMVLKIESGNASILFTGDIEKEAEDNMVHLGNLLQSDILKVPHHGGRTSSSENFIRIVKPEVAVVSAGRNNPFRHPHKETIKKYKNAGSRIMRTDQSGAVIISFNNGEIQVKTYEDATMKPVKKARDEIRNLKLLL